MKPTKEEKNNFFNLSLEDKIKKTKELILEWYLQYDGKVFISYSGGKDSTVLLHIARSINKCKDILAVFSDTGLEYPEIREHVKNTENVLWIKPKLTFKQVIEKYGYPIISKEQSLYIYQIQNTKSEYLKDVRLNGKTLKNGKKGFYISKKWKPLLNKGFKISNFCCDVMKKKPMKDFEKKYNGGGYKPIIGTMAEESSLRLQQYMKGNCNEYSSKHPSSHPLSFWTEQDILSYIKKYNIPIAKVYGEIEDKDGKLKTTGVDRTGCMFCMFGLHMEGSPNRFDKMKITHPKQYEYCMEKLGLKPIIEEYLKCAKKGIKEP